MLWAAALRCKVQGGQGRYWWSCAAFLSFLCSLIEMESSQQQESAGLEQLTSHPPASPVLNFHEANFIAFPNQRQSNIYGLCSLRINGCNKLLVATLRGQIFSLEFHKTPLRPPLFNPINFSYIPGKQKVI